MASEVTGQRRAGKLKGGPMERTMWLSGLWLALVVACGSESKTLPLSSEPAPPVPVVAHDGGASSDPAAVANAPDGASDAGSPVACVPSSAVTIYPGVGAASDDPIAPAGPGVVLMGGGTDVDQAFVWMHDTVAGSRAARAGDLIILRASGDDGYDAYAYGIAPFHSVRTIVVGTAATAADLACAADLVSRAEVVFFAGGNQAKYVAWAGSPLMTAVQHVYDRGGVIGGTSAGCAILGGFAYDAVSAGSSNVASSDAIADPFETSISFTRGALHFSVLDGVITDPHFRARDRMGRLAAFMARQHADGAVTTSPPRVLGIGVDEKTAVLVDKAGIARLVQQSPGTGAAFFVRGAVPDQCEHGKPLRYRRLLVTRLDAPAQTFSLQTWCGSGTVYELGVFGDAPPPYQPSDPYGAGPDGITCGP
jgi:cyanophycinase